VTATCAWLLNKRATGWFCFPDQTFKKCDFFREKVISCFSTSTRFIAMVRGQVQIRFFPACRLFCLFWL
jgi:hypothetical protein